MPKFPAICAAIFGAVLCGVSGVAAWQIPESDSGYLFVDVFFGLPLLGCASALTFAASRAAILRGALAPARTLAVHAVIVFAACSLYPAAQWWFIPSNIRVAFGNPGTTGTYQSADFWFKKDGRWLKGPSVEAWPMRVSFPDLNGDGYPDIRVVSEHHGEVEFIYLPQGEGRSFWRLSKRTGLTPNYPPGNVFYP